MNILQRFASFFKQAEVKNPFAIMAEKRFNEMFGSSARQQFLEANKSWVYACTQAIAQEVSNIDLKLMKTNADGEVEEVENHEIKDLLKKVNPRMTKHQLLEITQSHLELDGNAFWLLARDGLGAVREIWALRPDKVTIVQSAENSLLVGEYIYKRKDGGKIHLPAEDVLHFSDFNSEGDYPFPVRGVGRVQAASLAIDTNNFSREWNRVFFQNSAIPNILLKTEASLDPDGFAQLQEKFKQSFQGLAKAHKPMILEGGLEIEKLDQTQKEMDFVEQLKSSRDEILGIFRVPKSILGITEDVNRANAEASIFTFMRGTIEPKMQAIVDTLNEFLLSKFNDTENLFFAFTSPVPENRERIVNEYDKGHNKWLTTNDIRRAEGLPETIDGDRLFAPFNVAPIDEVKPQKSVKKPKDEKPSEKGTSTKKVIKETTHKLVSELFTKKNKTKKKKVKKVEVIEQLSAGQMTKFVGAWIKGLEDRRDKVRPVIEEYFEGQEDRVIKAVRAGLKGFKKKEYSLKQAENLLPDKEDEIQRAIDAMTPLYDIFLTDSGQLSSELVDPTFNFDPETAEAQEFIKTRSRFFAEKVNDTTYDELVTTIEEGITNNETITQIEDRIKQVYTKADELRVELIARTEVSAISNFGNLEGMKQAGATQKMWVVVDPLDADCVDTDGEVVGITEQFSNGLDAPPVHPNCQCNTIPIF